MPAHMLHEGLHAAERDADHDADPYDVLLRAGICRRCGGPCSWPPDDDDDPEPVSCCPACGDPIDYCQGHGEIGDPAGRAILDAHDDGDHSQCHPEGCAYSLR